MPTESTGNSPRLPQQKQRAKRRAREARRSRITENRFQVDRSFQTFSPLPNIPFACDDPVPGPHPQPHEERVSAEEAATYQVSPFSPVTDNFGPHIVAGRRTGNNGRTLPPARNPGPSTSGISIRASSAHGQVHQQAHHHNRSIVLLYKIQIL
ncbi:unnamed protein product [Haemonchus placei]|uniref:Uncharacterized protein n=1 Tax=Haemonchus placei TaxID=6290 RepID=A0A3P7WBP4_HAEPC|nr:unnamed protein product [Haemonchus placei]